jgi:hypothetical protein
MNLGGNRQTARRARWLGCAIAASSLLLFARAAHATEAEEYELKAEIVHRLTDFIEWPPSCFANAAAPFVIGVIGDTPIEAQLRKWETSRRVKDRRIVVRHIAAPWQVAGVHLLFIAREEQRRLKQDLAATSGQPVLTVADREGFATQGVLINLYVEEDGHVRFEINASEVKKSGLKVSSHLYKLARLVAGVP